MSRMRVFLGVLAFVGIAFLGAGCKPGEPLAGFTAEPTSGTAPLKVQFTDASVITKESTITGWSWNFGDGGTSTDQDPEHTYTVTGSHTVTLTVTSSDGKTNTATVPNCVTVTLTAVPNVVGMAGAAAEAAITGAGLVVGTVTFEHHATVPAGSVISQDPTSGTGVLPGSAVNLIFSKGPFVIETLTILLPGNVPLELVRIPAGSFQMGSPDTERGRWSGEGPLHKVTIGYDFCMGKYEVTQGQWLAVMGTNSGVYEWDYGAGADYPAYYVSWDDTQTFITAVNAHIASTGQGPATLRLPSEAEWEYACRAGTRTRFHFGDSLGGDDDCEDDGARSQYMWYCGNNTYWRSKPVGGKLPNGFGLYDMSGNLWEWCEDWWHDDYTGAPTDGSAWTSSSAWVRVLRGGGFDSRAQQCRSAYRSAQGSSARYPGIGFRLAADDTGPIVPVPDVTGMTRAEAEAAIMGAGLVVGTVMQGSSDTVPAGSVISQNPASGTGVLLGSAVSFVVSSGPEGTGGDTVTILLPDDVPLELVRIPGGSFQMGSPDTERNRTIYEGPVHLVHIGYDFYMAKYEVTQGQWLAVMRGWPDEAPSLDYGLGSDYSAYNVSWDDAKDFIETLNAHITASGQGPMTVCLPSEAEWEYACRAGTQARFHFGDSLGVADGCEDDEVRSQYMWYCGNNEPSGSKPVGGLLPNGFGLYDMHGNLWEWCEDRWHDDYTGAPTDGSARVSSSDSRRVIRSGSWTQGAQLCRSAYRGNYPFPRNINIGFRLVAHR